mmetsp:Transcript_6248/g.16112  ORF Transcript_6248/g.16112 Transcript_6248/m.16112 type:complete len:160 (+) Transcript_6248:1-480(+)
MRLERYRVELSCKANGSKRGGGASTISETAPSSAAPSANTSFTDAARRSPQHSPHRQSDELCRPSQAGASSFSLGRRSSTFSALNSRRPNPVSPYKLGRRISRAAKAVLSKAKGLAARIAQGRSSKAPSALASSRSIPSQRSSEQMQAMRASSSSSARR